jgi:hypothetical protein
VCTPKVQLSLKCAGCVCTTVPDCGQSVSKCDASCWSLVACGYDRCIGSFDAECLERECGEHSSAVDAALAVAGCISPCYGNCYDDLRRLGADDMDAGL